MALVVRNEQADPWTFNTSRIKKVIQAGDIAILSDIEWDSVIPSKRGPGALNPLWPNESLSETEQSLLDYYTTNGAFELRYFGTAVQSAIVTNPVWTIKRLEHVLVAPSDVRVSRIQVLSNVAWGNSTSDRDALAWNP